MPRQLGSNNSLVFDNVATPNMSDNAQGLYNQVIQNAMQQFSNANQALATVAKVDAMQYEKLVSDWESNERAKANASQGGSNPLSGLADIGKALTSAYMMQEEVKQRQAAAQADYQFKERQVSLEEKKFALTKEEKLAQAEQAKNEGTYKLLEAELNNRITTLEGDASELMVQYGVTEGIGQLQNRMQSDIYDSEEFKMLPAEYRLRVVSKNNTLLTQLRKQRAAELDTKQKELTNNQLEANFQKFQINNTPILSKLKSGAGVLDESEFNEIVTQFNDNMNTELQSPLYADPLNKTKFYKQAVGLMSQSISEYYKESSEMNASQAKWVEANQQLEALQIAYDSNEYGWTAADLYNKQKQILLGLGISDDPNLYPTTRQGAINQQVQEQKVINDYGEVTKRTNNLKDLGLNDSQKVLYERAIVGANLYNALNGGGRELTISQLEYKVKNDPNSPTVVLDNTQLSMLKRYDGDKKRYFELRQEYLSYKKQIEDMRYVPNAQYRDPFGTPQLSIENGSITSKIGDDRVQVVPREGTIPTSSPEAIQAVESKMEVTLKEMDELAMTWGEYGINIANPSDKRLFEALQGQAEPVKQIVEQGKIQNNVDTTQQTSENIRNAPKPKVQEPPKPTSTNNIPDSYGMSEPMRKQITNNVVYDITKGGYVDTVKSQANRMFQTESKEMKALASELVDTMSKSLISYYSSNPFVEYNAGKPEAKNSKDDSYNKAINSPEVKAVLDKFYKAIDSGTIKTERLEALLDLTGTMSEGVYNKYNYYYKKNQLPQSSTNVTPTSPKPTTSTQLKLDTESKRYKELNLILQNNDPSKMPQIVGVNGNDLNKAFIDWMSKNATTPQKADEAFETFANAMKSQYSGGVEPTMNYYKRIKDEYKRRLVSGNVQSSLPSNPSSGNRLVPNPNKVSNVKPVTLMPNEDVNTPSAPLKGNLAVHNIFGYAPFKGGQVTLTSKMGEPRDGGSRSHDGIDLTSTDPRVATIQGGVVKDARSIGKYGNVVVVQTPDGRVELFAHLSRIDVRVGQVLNPASTIGVMGDTGNAKGHPHVHFETWSRYDWNNRGTIDPLVYLREFKGKVELPTTVPTKNTGDNNLQFSSGAVWTSKKEVFYNGYIVDKFGNVRRATKNDSLTQTPITVRTVANNTRKTGSNSTNGTVTEYEHPKAATKMYSYMVINPDKYGSGYVLNGYLKTNSGVRRVFAKPISLENNAPDEQYNLLNTGSGLALSGTGGKVTFKNPTDADIVKKFMLEKGATAAFVVRTPKSYSGVYSSNVVNGKPLDTSGTLSIYREDYTTLGSEDDDYGYSVLKSSPKIRKALYNLAVKLDIPMVWLADMINAESTWKGNADNGIGYLGLFQYSKANRDKLGLTPADFNGSEQGMINQINAWYKYAKDRGTPLKDYETVLLSNWAAPEQIPKMQANRNGYNISDGFTNWKGYRKLGSGGGRRHYRFSGFVSKLHNLPSDSCPVCNQFHRDGTFYSHIVYG